MEEQIAPPRTDNELPPPLIDLSLSSSADCPPTFTNCSTNPLPSSEAALLSALVLNCQSLVAKKESFINLLDVYHPDIVFGSESWLKPNILSSEMFPSGYTVYQKDRHDGYGGVFIACRNTLISSKLQLNVSHPN